MTEAHKSLLRIYGMLGPQFTMSDVKRHGFQDDLKRCQRAGLIERAGYQTTVAAEDFINSIK